MKWNILYIGFIITLLLILIGMLFLDRVQFQEGQTTLADASGNMNPVSTGTKDISGNIDISGIITDTSGNQTGTPAKQVPGPLPPNPILLQIQKMVAILNDPTMNTNASRLNKIKTELGNIKVPNTPLTAKIADWISDNKINCITAPRTENINKIISKFGCDGKTGNAEIDALLNVNAANEADATTAVNNLRLLSADAISNLMAAQMAGNTLNVVTVPIPPKSFKPIIG